MEAQKPAEGILAMKAYRDAKFFRIPCECGCEGQIDFSIEVDEDMISTHLFATTKTNYWRQRFNLTYEENWMLFALKDFANDWYNRLAIVWTALTKGYIETEAWVLMSKQQTINFSETLKDVVKEFDERQEKARDSSKV